jgi:hypothetical protein
MTDITARQVQTPALVYVRSLRGKPSPQVWWEPAGDIDGYWRGRIPAWHLLDVGTAGLPLAVLQQIYPAPAMPAE